MLATSSPDRIQIAFDDDRLVDHAGLRGYHPLVAVAAGTGEVLMARLRGGRANTARGGRPLPA